MVNPKQGKRDHWLRNRRVRAERFLHPDHVLPGAELIAAPGEVRNGLIAKFAMKGLALRIGIGDAGIEVYDVLLAQAALERFIEQRPDSLPGMAKLYIYAHLDRPIISRPPFERARISVA